MAVTVLEFSSGYSVTAFGLSLLGILAIFAFALSAQVTGCFQFWPPPEGKSWQHRSFLLLFRLYLYPLIALSILEFELASGVSALWQYFVGGILLLVGFGLAMRITLQMGWRNAFGEKKGLITEGWFSISRNPVYVVTWIGLLGWGLIVGKWSVAALLVLWAIMYVLAPFLEEPWLERQYGEEFKTYKSKVPRFL